MVTALDIGGAIGKGAGAAIDQATTIADLQSQLAVRSQQIKASEQAMRIAQSEEDRKNRAEAASRQAAEKYFSLENLEPFSGMKPEDVKTLKNTLTHYGLAEGAGTMQDFNSALGAYFNDYDEGYSSITRSVVDNTRGQIEKLRKDYEKKHDPATLDAMSMLQDRLSKELKAHHDAMQHEEAKKLRKEQLEQRKATQNLAEQHRLSREQRQAEQDQLRQEGKEWETWYDKDTKKTYNIQKGEKPHKDTDVKYSASPERAGEKKAAEAAAKSEVKKMVTVHHWLTLKPARVNQNSKGYDDMINSGEWYENLKDKDIIAIQAKRKAMMQMYGLTAEQVAKMGPEIMDMEIDMAPGHGPGK